MIDRTPSQVMAQRDSTVQNDEKRAAQATCANATPQHKQEISSSLYCSRGSAIATGARSRIEDGISEGATPTVALPPVPQTSTSFISPIAN